MSIATNPTCFLTAVKEIKKARERFAVPSENWTYPTRYRFGTPIDKYYAEIWTDGMDWQTSYWIIEYVNWETNIHPLLIFDDHGDKFNDYDFQNFCEAMMYYRREQLCYQRDDLGIYNDNVWPFIHLIHPDKQHPNTHELSRYYVEHASQPIYEFWVNNGFIPSHVRTRYMEINKT